MPPIRHGVADKRGPPKPAALDAVFVVVLELILDVVLDRFAAHRVQSSPAHNVPMQPRTLRLPDGSKVTVLA